MSELVAEQACCSVVNLAALREAPFVSLPFPYVLVPGFVRPDIAAAVRQDFPSVEYAGLLPAATTGGGAVFRALLEELGSGELEAAFAEKFGLDLEGHPLMITVRGHCDARDGRIHTDSRSKLLTALLYFNEPWREDGGRLRLLRSGQDIEDVIAEVPPNDGTLIAFQRTDRSFHGHKPYIGPRRYVMFNWMSGRIAAGRERTRHRVSAWLKQLAGQAI
jgi:hypothetical protein